MVKCGAALVLKTLCESERALNVTEIARALGHGAGLVKLRKKIIASLGCLLRRELAAVAEKSRRRSSFEEKAAPAASYAATEKGRDFHRSGKRIKCGPLKQRHPLRAYKPDAFYQRLWKVLRFSEGRRATIPELIEIARAPGDPGTLQLSNNARAYLLKLARAGVVVRMTIRARGDAPTSNGFVRFALPKDLGPLAPVTRKGFVFDPNSRTQIEYRKEPTS
jgi:hypothetical protein